METSYRANLCSASDNPLIDPTCMSVTSTAMNESRTKSRANLENSVAELSNGHCTTIHCFHFKSNAATYISRFART